MIDSVEIADAKGTRRLEPERFPLALGGDGAEIELGDVAAGKTLYATCSSCHGQRGEGNKSMNSPPLTHMSDWYLVSSLEKYKKGIRGGNPANTNAVLMRGMSNMLTNDQAIKDVVAYISTLQ